MFEKRDTLVLFLEIGNDRVIWIWGFVEGGIDIFNVSRNEHVDLGFDV